MADDQPEAAKVAPLVTYREDFPRFCAEILRIQTKKAQLVPFVLNRAQRRVWELVKEDLDAGRPIRFFILKARQLGFSTLIQAVMYWLCTLWRNHTALVCAHEEGAASTLFLKSQIFYKSSPQDMRPMMRVANRQEMHFANPNPKAPPEEMGLESRIVVRTANNKNLGASMTLQGLHLSEFAKYDGVLQNVKVAIATVLQTVPQIPGTYIFLETTADGMGYSYDFWHGDNGYRKVFISWIAEEEYTVPAAELRISVPDLDEVDDARFGNELWVRERILSELKFWYPERAEEPDWYETEALCRLQWRRRMIAGQFSDDLDLFRQEYPITAEEAFLTSGAAVFNQRKLRDWIQALEVRDETGHVTDLVHPPKCFRFDRDVKDFYHAKHGPLRVYQEAKPGHRYVIGADVAEGLHGGDKSVAQVLEVPTFKQVAVFQETIEPDDYADVLFHLGRVYNWAALCVEANGPGLVTNSRLGKDLVYPNLYRREQLDADRRQVVKKFGWFTSRGNKTVMINELRAAVRDELIQFRDIETLRDMACYVQHDNGSMGAMYGEHDDTVMALALALQMVMQTGTELMRRPGMNVAHTPGAGPPPGSFEWVAREASRRREGALTAEYYKKKFGLR
jgi:hypothetical protein